MNRCTPAVPGTRTFNAALSFIKRNRSPLLRIEAAGLQNVRRIVNYRAARFANHTHEPLGQDAVQRRHKVVRLDSHVQESPDNVDHVVRVDGGEHEVTGKSRVDGNLRSFRVTDFTDHDLVGIVTQNGAQATRKGQSFFLVYRNLRDATQLVLDRIFN